MLQWQITEEDPDDKDEFAGVSLTLVARGIPAIKEEGPFEETSASAFTNIYTFGRSNRFGRAVFGLRQAGCGGYDRWPNEPARGFRLNYSH